MVVDVSLGAIRICYSLGLSTAIVPHQFRHYAGFRTIPGEFDFRAVGGSLVNILPA